MPARWRRWKLITAATVGAIALLYLVDIALSAGQIPRGVVVAGVDIGGLDRASAERRLRQEIQPRLDRPALVVADGHRAAVHPEAARIAMDWASTAQRAAQPSYSPWHRLVSLFVDRPVDPSVHGNDRAVATSLQPLRTAIDVRPREGSIRFEDGAPSPVDPVAGRRLDIERAARTVIERWAAGRPIELTVTELPVTTTPDGVRAALARFAKPAVSGPVTVEGRGIDVTLSPAAIGRVLTFEPDDAGGLTPKVPVGKLESAIGKDLAKTEKKSRDARIAFGKKKATVRPSVDGRAVDWTATAAGLVEVLPRQRDRVLEVTYVDTPAKLTEAELEKLDITEVIGEFTTSNFAYDSGINIRTVAKEVNGAIIKPGKTFSLNGYTGPRGLKQGYVAAAVIENGELSRAVGGGISQFATTLYNASYFAGMVDVEHTEHSFYISRYPVAREATVYQRPDGSSVIDLKFTNDSTTGVAIQTIWTPNAITVRLWGTERYKVKSITGAKRNFTGIPVKTKPWGQPCSPSSGVSGFTATDTRVIRDVAGKEVSRKSRTVVYRPLDAIRCAPPPKPEPKPEPEPSPKPKPSPKPSREPE
ncbi:MAG: VanW family protein [Haloechinothrix sp.]